MAGYLFQCRVALLRGLQMAKKKPNGHISIERFDDIAFEDADPSVCLLQAKHSVVPKSLADGSEDVWKTIGIWLDYVSEDTLALSSTRFGLITTSCAPDGSAMALLRPGTSASERRRSLSILRDVAQSSANERTAPERSVFQALTDTQATAFLNQIDVLDHHSNLVDVMAEIEGELVLLAPSRVSRAASDLEGWWLGVVAVSLTDETSPSIPVQHIISKANEIGRSLGEDALPLDDPQALGAKDYSPDDEAALFVRQMRAVNLSDSLVRRGTRDYYRAFAQRSKWARDKLLLDAEIGRYDAKLQDTWERKFDADLAVEPPETPTDKQTFGRRLCVWSVQQSIPLRNIVEAWITSGSFQGLAEHLRVGWHPDFRSIFGQDVSDDSP